MARASGHRRLHRDGPARPLGQGRRRLDGEAGRTGRVFPRRLGRPRVRHLPGRARRPPAGDAPDPGARRRGQGREAAGGSGAGGGRRPEGGVRRRGLPPQGRAPPLAAPLQGRRRSPRGARQAQPRQPEPGDRRHVRVRLVRDRADRRPRPARHARVAAEPGPRIRAVHDQLGPRQLARALRRPAPAALRPRAGFLPARGRQEDGQAGATR